MKALNFDKNQKVSILDTIVSPILKPWVKNGYGFVVIIYCGQETAWHSCLVCRLSTAGICVHGNHLLRSAWHSCLVWTLSTAGLISEKIKTSNWGEKVLENVSNDLKDEFPEMKGFSVSNLKTCKLFYEYFQFSPQLGDPLNSIKNKFGSQPVNNL